MEEREKGAQDWFKKGTEAMNHKNWDYAVKAFGMCVVLMPEVILYRQSKHGCIRKSFNDNGSGAKMAGMRLMGIRGRIKKCRLQKDWKGVVTGAGEGFLVNPWGAQLMIDQGVACENPIAVWDICWSNDVTTNRRERVSNASINWIPTTAMPVP